MDLESEPVAVSGDWAKRAATLRRHGATENETSFLRHRRVELNAMTSPQLVAFVEAKLSRHGVSKFIPERDVVERHARRTIEGKLLEEAVAKISGGIAAQAKGIMLPTDINQQIEAVFAKHPSVSWDEAVARIIRGRA